MNTGGGDDPHQPAAGDADQPFARSNHEPSAPWERPQRWADESDDSTNANDLIARLSAGGTAFESRRRRRASDSGDTGDTGDTGDDGASDGHGVPASELIAALMGGEPEAKESAEDPAIDDDTSTDDEVSDEDTDVAAEGPVEPAATSEPPTELSPSDRTPDDPVPDDPAGFDRATGSLAPISSSSNGTAPSTTHDEGPAAHADRPSRGWLVAGRSFIAVLAVLLLVTAGTHWVIKARADAALSDNQISALDPNDTNITSPTTSQTHDADNSDGAGDEAEDADPSKTYQAENILVLGSDSRVKPADSALGGANSDSAGSDVVMVAHLSADRSHVTVVSIPRDTYIEAPSCKAWDYQSGEILDEDFQSSYSMWRINSTFAAGGPPCTVKAVQQFTGLRIDRVIVIDFSGFAAMVDALDGITVNACGPIIDRNLGTVLPKAGEQHIDGKQALSLVRARKVQGDTTSDLARIRRQQKVLSTILQEMTSADVLFHPVKLDSALQAFVQNVQTDNVSIDSLLDIAQSLGNLDPRRVTFFTLPTTPDSNEVGLHPADHADLIWQALRKDEPLPGEVTDPVEPVPTTTTTPKSTSSVAPPTPVTQRVTQLSTSTPNVPQTLSIEAADIDIQIVNVAGRGGVATQAMNALVPLGFEVSDPSDLLLVEGQTQSGITVEYAPDNRAAALTVAAAVPGSNLDPTDGLGTKVRLMLGSSFDGTVTAVSGGAPLPSALSTTADPVVETIVSTLVTTPSAPATTSSSETTPTTGQTLPSSDITSVNAGTAGCI